MDILIFYQDEIILIKAKQKEKLMNQNDFKNQGIGDINIGGIDIEDFINLRHGMIRETIESSIRDKIVEFDNGVEVIIDESWKKSSLIIYLLGRHMMREAIESNIDFEQFLQALAGSWKKENGLNSKGKVLH